MTRHASLAGEKFGRLLVLRPIEQRKYGWQYWCRCDCGTEKSVDGGAMKRGDTLSCGCHRSEQGRAKAARLFYTKSCVTCGEPMERVRAAQIACSPVCHALSLVIPEPNSGCWLWLGSLDSSGYGIFEFKGKSLGAHRVLHDWKKGAPPPDYERDHLCRTRCCANPDHVEAVTASENVRRGHVARGTAR